jgi:hypothetical protein
MPTGTIGFGLRFRGLSGSRKRMAGPTSMLAVPLTDRGSGAQQPIGPGAFAPIGPRQPSERRGQTYSTMRLHRCRGGPIVVWDMAQITIELVTEAQFKGDDFRPHRHQSNTQLI